MSEVKRYECADTSRYYMQSCGMEEDSLGDYVTYSDYEKLKAQLEKAERLLEIISQPGKTEEQLIDRSEYTPERSYGNYDDCFYDGCTQADAHKALAAREYFKEKEQA